MKQSSLERFDEWMLRTATCIGPELMRIALAIVYIWFGVLKLFAMSPAEAMVGSLLLKTMPLFPAPQFVVLFGLFEILIGVMFLVPKLTRLAILFLVVHMFTTFLPLILLPDLTWYAPFVPTLTGQYILKNVIILALAMGVGLDLEPLKRSVPKKQT